MKKHLAHLPTVIIALTVIFCFHIPCLAQYEIYYALRAQKLDASKVSDPELKAFLQNPFDKEYDYKNIVQGIANEYNAANHFKVGQTKEKNLDDLPVTGSLFASSLGGLMAPSISQSEILLAITDVMISRAKEELAIAYFDRLADSMEKRPIQLTGKVGGVDKVVIDFKLKDIFPNLYTLVKDNRAQYNVQLGNTLKQAFEKDVLALPNNLQSIFTDEGKKLVEVSALSTMLLLSQQVKSGLHPAEVLNNIKPAVLNNDWDHALNLMSGISASIRVNPTIKGMSTSEWITYGEVVSLTDLGKKYYLALLYLNTQNNVSFKDYGVSMATLKAIESDANKTNSIMANAIQIVASLGAIENNIRPIMSGEQPRTDEEKRQIAITSSRQLVDVLEKTLAITKIIKGNEAVNPQVIFIAKKGIDVAEYIGNREYGASVIAVIQIVESVINVDQKLPQSLVKLLTVSADIAQADNAADAKNILEQAILPVGSYKIKHRVHFSASLNAYVGANAGFEVLDDTRLDKQGSGYAGLFLPIGVNLSWSKGTEDSVRCSHSLFFSAIDLGAIASYRIKNNSDDELDVDNIPNIKFTHVISPGIFYIHGLKASPVVFGIGAQLSPRLREITDASGASLGEATAFRFSAFVAVDIPAWHFGLRGKKKELGMAKP